MTRLRGLVCNNFPRYKHKKNTNLSSQPLLCSYVLQFESGLFSVFMWRHGRHVGVQNNSEKSLLGLWFYHYAKLEQHFAIVLNTNTAVSITWVKTKNWLCLCQHVTGQFLLMVTWIRALIDKIASVMSKLNYTNFFKGWVHKSDQTLFLPFNFGTSCNSNCYKMEGDRIWKASALFLSLLYSAFHFLKNTCPWNLRLKCQSLLTFFLRAPFTQMIKFHWGM